MAQYSQGWDGSDVGHAFSRAPYSADEQNEMYETWIGSLGDHGIIPGIDNELTVAVVGANTVSMDTGCAMVRGKWYRNTAIINTINVPSATAGNWREDCICLRALWAAKTVTVERHENDNENVAWDNDDLNQTHGTTWEIPLGNARVTDAGIVTVTDGRRFLKNVITEELWGAEGFEGYTFPIKVGGAIATAAWDNAYMGFNFDPDSEEAMAKWWLIPAHVRGAMWEFELFWYGTGAPGVTPDVVWQIYMYRWTCEEDMTIQPMHYSWLNKVCTVAAADDLICEGFTVADGANWAGSDGWMTGPLSFLEAYAGEPILVVVWRDADAGVDDYASDARVVGLRIRLT